MSKPNYSIFDELGADRGARIRHLISEREADGLNVHFTRADGTSDRFSFATKERADRFRAKLDRQGLNRD